MENFEDPSDLTYINKGKKSLILCISGRTYYRIRQYLDGSIVWRCSSKSCGKFNCSGTVKIKNDVIIKSNEHNSDCKPDLAKVEVQKEIAECKNKLATTHSHKSVPEVYNKTVVSVMDKGYDKVCKVPTFSSVKSSLYSARNKGEGMPKFCFDNPSEVIVPFKYSSFLLCDYNDNGERILVFCAREIRYKVGLMKHIFGDGTFKACPSPFQQLYTIHYDALSIETDSNIIPFIYALMTGMSKKSYTMLFRMLKSQFPEFEPNKFTSDYEHAARGAAVDVFPSIEVKGCYYHYSNSVWRRARKLKLTKPGYTKQIIALTGVLPLLPSQHVREGWCYVLSKIDFLRQRATFCTNGLNKFATYFENFWLKSDDFITTWSNFGERHRTNNNVEGWNNKLNRACRNKNVNLIQLLKVLAEDAALSQFKRRQIENKQILKKRNPENVIRDNIIIDLQVQLVNGIINIPLFLESLRTCS